MKKTIFILLSGLSRSSAAVVRMDVTRMYHCSSVETGLMFSHVIYQRVNSSYPETTANSFCKYLLSNNIMSCNAVSETC